MKWLLEANIPWFIPQGPKMAEVGARILILDSHMGGKSPTGHHRRPHESAL